VHRAAHEDMQGTTTQRTFGAWRALAAGLLSGALLACQAILSLDDYRMGPADAGAGGSAGMGGGGSLLDGGAGSGCGGTCDPSFLPVQGTVRAYDTELPLAGVLVETADGEVTSDQNGHFSLRAEASDWVALTLNWPEAESMGLSLPFRRTVLAFAGGSDQPRVLDVPVVRHGWLEDLARDCGVLPSDASPALVQSYFSERNTMLVEVAGGNAAGITREQIEIYVERDGDVHANLGTIDPDDDLPPTLCFLETGDAGGPPRGGVGDQTDAAGRFVAFRLRNATGSGTGTAHLRIVNFAAPAPVAFVGAGLTGVVRVARGW
jgi:hypothetical protein